MTRESYLKKNYLAIVSVEEKDLMKHIMRENILVNLRTFDNHSLVLYANDNVNNFVQIHLDEGRFVVFMFNYGNQIRNITVEDPGNPIQNFIDHNFDTLTYRLSLLLTLKSFVLSCLAHFILWPNV